MENCHFQPNLEYIPYHNVYKKCYSNDNYTYRMNNNNNNQETTDHFMSGTGFQVPSFGDEDFDLLSQVPLMLPSEQQQGHGVPADQDIFNTQNTTQMMNNPVTMASNMSQNSNIFSNLENTVNLNPTFPPQNFYDPDINMSNAFQGNSPNYGGNNMFQNVAMTTGQAMFQGQSNQGLMSTAGQQQSLMNTGVSNTVGYPVGSVPGVTGGVNQGSPIPGTTTTTSPPRESTSEDSDDSLPLAQLVSLKRQAANNDLKKSPLNVPSPPNKSPPPAKKPKTPKRKKKKDPNEPQKPVSAYALFFRDTQAAIKGQNPSASFGEVSKIVAAMWDGLDPDHKNGYKKKTEMAKKEYLKQLAAYRASQVSLAAVEESSGNEQSPPYQQQPMQVSQGSPTLMGDNSHMMVNTMDQMSPPQVINYSPPHHQQAPPLVHHYQPSQPVQPTTISYQPHNQANYSGRINSQCIRNGCGNNAINSPCWDEEYCSSECVVSHCRDVFTAWVANRQATSTFPVK